MGGGKTWFSAAELAELALPGLPKAKRKINERAAAEGWALRTSDAGKPLARPRAGRGGGLDYHLDLLPASARAALAARGVAALEVSGVANVSDRPKTRAAGLWRWYEGASAKARAEAKRRAGIVALVDSYEAAGLTRSAAVTTAAARGEVGASTLWAWLALVEGVSPADRLPFLAPRRGGGGAEAALDSGAWQFLISDYLRPEKPTFSSCYWRMARGYAAPRGLAVPCERTLRRKFDREVDGRLVIARREGAEALRRSIPAQERSVASLHALEALNIDGHTFDVFVRWEDGRVGRATMVALQDLHSRKIVAQRIDESENAIVTRLVFADCFREWGIPAACVLDNGRAFASKAITGGAKTRYRFKIKDEDPMGILPALGIRTHWAMPFRGQSKPIERGFRDMCDAIAKHPAFAGAYTGNNPLAKPENYGSQAVPIALFREVVAKGIAAHNARPNRRTETAQGRMSFDDVFAASYAVAPIGKASPEQLRMALLTAEERTCDWQTAVVTLEGNRYWCEALAPYAGSKLTVRFDPDDLHSEVHVYDRQGAFIATAPVIAAVGFFDKASAGKRRAQEKAVRVAARDAADAADLLDAATLAAMLADYEDESGVPVPQPSVIRPVRHRAFGGGGTGAALKVVSTPSQEPLQTPVIDRFAAAIERRLRVVE